jgi:hypothetical protein
VAYYLFNFERGVERAVDLLRVGMWGVDADERHLDALASGDLALVYLAAPEREFIARAELASAVREWTPSEAQRYPGDASSGVLLARVEEWYPPVPMSAVLARIDPREKAKADFDFGVVRITAGEYETAVAVARARSEAG